MPGSTPIYGFPYPEATDLVADYPALGQELAEDVETAIAASSKIVQIVRATDTTSRNTTSTSYVDVTGMSVTITPTKVDSAIIVLSVFNAQAGIASGQAIGYFSITDASNIALSGAEEGRLIDSSVNISAVFSMVGYSTPATISATTYKMRFKANSGATTTIRNDINTGQMYAIEVSA